MSGGGVQSFESRVLGDANQMQGYGDNIAERVAVAKVLKSFTQRFDHIVTAIEESKDLTKLRFN